MKKVANPVNYPGCANLQTDSWAVAGTGSYAPCNLATPTAYKTVTECVDFLTITNYANTACRGCLDSTSIFNSLIDGTTAVTDFDAVLTGRYGVTGDCGTFKT